MTERRLADIDFGPLRTRTFFPSPAAWEDQVVYFLMLDRFSDGNEQGYRDNQDRVVAAGRTPPFQPGDAGNAVRTEDDAARWRAAGGGFVGGTLRGLTSKLGYLRRLGVTAIWVSPVFKQVAFRDTYHGYGVQNFLDVDPHFGTREDLRAMVRAAHEQGLHVILDIIFNHTGDVFEYAPDRYPTPGGGLDARWDGRPYAVRGFRDRGGHATLPFGSVDLDAHPGAWPDGAVWPAELQAPETFTCKGRISNWDFDPEFREGDFFDLKDVSHGHGGLDDYRPSRALVDLAQAFRFWIAYADVDGFRIDTVKHMDLGATRFVASVIHEAAQRLGKDNFYLIGEITGGRQRAYETLEVTGLDAALGIDDIPDKLEWLVKGYREPREYFDLFRNSRLVRKESHVWFRNTVVTLYDDHDQVRKGQAKARFAADPLGQALAINALALNATTLGIPCIYYGSEQGFDGQGGEDRFIREAMFGGEFGPFRSRGRHCFDESHRLYAELSEILAIRRARPALRRGRQNLREISGDGQHFGIPHMVGGEIRSIVAWSRILDDEEVLCAINTDAVNARRAWVTIDAGLHAAGEALACIHSTDATQVGGKSPVESRNGKAVEITLPPAGFAIWA